MPHGDDALPAVRTQPSAPAEGLSVEVLVADNDPVGGSGAMVRRGFPEGRPIANAGNAGFGRIDLSMPRCVRLPDFLRPSISQTARRYGII